MDVLKEVSEISRQKLASTYVRATFKALTDALLPSATHRRFEPDLGVHDYVIYSLDHYIEIQKQLNTKVIPLSYPTAELLDAAAHQMISRHELYPYQQPLFPGGSAFSCLSSLDRLRVLSALETLALDLYLLPNPYQNNAGLIKFMVDALNRLTLFGYYSEWPAYGTTRLYPPCERRLEFFPLAWQQVGYPGVAYGYRDFRGYLLTLQEARGNG